MELRTRSIPSAFIVALVGVMALTVAPPAPAEGDGEPEAQADDATPQVAAAAPLQLPVYNPPKVGKPARTIGGGSRGPGDGYADLYVLVPDHVAQTASDQPSLFWFVDEVPAGIEKVVFTLHDEDGIDPLVEASLASLEHAGIQRIALSDYDVKLEPGVEYEWSVSLVPTPAARADAKAKEVTSSGWIDRVKAPAGMDRTVQGLASQGLWYDALDALEEQIRAKPGDKDLRAMRSALLRQVGLVEVANASM